MATLRNTRWRSLQKDTDLQKIRFFFDSTIHYKTGIITVTKTIICVHNWNDVWDQPDATIMIY